MVKFSPVAFDSTGAIALVYRYWDCGPSCGNGGFCLLRLRSGVWTVEKHFDGWVSGLPPNPALGAAERPRRCDHCYIEVKTRLVARCNCSVGAAR